MFLEGIQGLTMCKNSGESELQCKTAKSDLKCHLGQLFSQPSIYISCFCHSASKLCKVVTTIIYMHEINNNYNVNLQYLQLSEIAHSLLRHKWQTAALVSDRTKV